MGRARRLAGGARNYIRARVRWRDVVLVALVGVSLLYSVHYANALQASQQRQGSAERAAQQRQGALIEQKLCTTLDRLAALTPPPGSPSGNPSRAYEQALHSVLAELGPDVGCREGHRR